MTESLVATPVTPVRLPQAEHQLLVVEGLRGIAALLVVYAHYWNAAGLDARLSAFAFTGVDLFFVLSGFVFAPYFFGKSLEIAPFFIRRFFRIYPVYFCGVIAYWLLKGGVNGGLWEVLAKHLVFLHTWENYEVAFSLNPAFWSLPPEVEFYLLLPFLVRAVQGTRSVLLLASIAIVARLALSWMSPSEVGVINPALIANFHLPGLLCEFLCGVIAWKFAMESSLQFSKRIACAVGLAGLAFGAWWFSIEGDVGIVANGVTRGNVGLFAAVCFALIVACIGTLQVCSPILIPLCKTAGALSFGLYVFHNAALGVVTSLLGNGIGSSMLALGVSLFTAGAVYILVEQPLRLFGRATAVQWGR